MNGSDEGASVLSNPAKLPGTFWGITVCFNPAGYRTKYDHLRRFSESARRQGLKLLIVELALRGQPFELPDSVADVVIRLASDTVLWHKERLLNIALEALPEDCDKVAWLDADLLFENGNWLRDTAQLLEIYVVVQPFQYACWLPRDVLTIPPDGSLEAASVETQPATAFAQLSNTDASVIAGHPGFAWSARRSVLQKHGFYDRFILGGGDSVMGRAMYGLAELWPGRGWSRALLTPGLESDLRRWSDAFYRDVQESVYFTQGRVFHLWHGEKKHRNYVFRLMILHDAAFDPFADIALDSAQCWRWNSHKPDLHRKVEEYFRSRKEEGETSLRGTRLAAG
jgi:hypothetical protein